MRWVKPQSLYLQLLLFLGLPLLLLWGLSAFNSYVSALQAATQAYDRTLLSSARTVSERLVVHNGKLGERATGRARQLRAEHERSPLLQGRGP